MSSPDAERYVAEHSPWFQYGAILSENGRTETTYLAL